MLNKKITSIAVFFSLLLLPLQVVIAIDRNSNISTQGTVSLEADTEAIKPLILSVNLSETGDQANVIVQAEANAKIEIRTGTKLLTTLQTDDTKITETNLPIQEGFNSFQLITTDYWGNISETTELTIEKEPDLVIISHQDNQLTFTETDEITLPNTGENTYSIISLNKNPSSLFNKDVTIKDRDMVNDTDGDSLTDAIEILNGNDPNTNDSLFSDQIDIIDLNDAIFTNPNFFIYGTTPTEYSLRIYLKNETGARYLAWSGNPDASGTFTAHTPFPAEGTFTLILQATDQNGIVKYEQEHGVITYNRSAEEVPLTANAHYKVNSPAMQTSIFSIEEIGRLGTTTLFGPNIDLQFQGETNPLSKIFILWKGETEWFLQTVSNPESGTFNIQSPETIPGGNYTAYIYSQDLKTNIISNIIRANFNVTSTDSEPHFMPINTITYTLAALAYLAAIGWVSLSIKKHIHKQSFNETEQP